MKAMLTLGDWSHDGHSITDTVHIDIPDHLKFPYRPKARGTWGCSKNHDLWGYYDLAVNNGAPDITKFCDSYDDYNIPYDVAVSLKEMFGDAVDFVDGMTEGEDVYVSSEDYAHIWVSIVNKGIELNGENGVVFIVPTSGMPNFNIGGYGLFSP